MKNNLEKKLLNSINGHRTDCYYCDKECNALAGNPSLWPIPLCHPDDPGKVKYHHIGCVSERLFTNYEQTVLPLFNKEVDGKCGEIPCPFYYALALNEEAGEVAGKIKKLFRDNNGIITPEIKEAIMKEMGDVLAYLAALGRSINTDLTEVAMTNAKKLTDRYTRGVMGGSGDNR